MSEGSRNKIFLCLLGVVLGYGLFTFVKSEDDISEIENRTLATFSHFNLSDFFSDSFQENFEAAISDQFLFSPIIRVGYNNAIGGLPTFGLEKEICKRQYLELANSIDRPRATYNCDDYMLYFPEELSEEKREIMLENIQLYNNLNKLSNVYYYFVNDSSVYDFRYNKKIVDYVEILKENLIGNYKVDEFDYKDYENYKKFFYKTDHHWDYRGSYQGYLEIAKLLGISRPLKYLSIETNHEDYFGSLARNTKNYNVREEFSYYTFDLKPFTTVINGKSGSYGHLKEYQDHAYNYDKDTNYYAYLYGDDEGEIIFNFRQPTEDNLLIISNSYSNPINVLIASHFNKTFVVDLRHYEQFMGKDFSYSDYIYKNKIDKVLVIMSPTFVTERNNNRGLEK